MSTTLVNQRLIHVYGNEDVSGIVLDPFEAELLCAYGNDGGTMTKLCDPPGISATCLPGCYQGTPNWCTRDSVYDCAWKRDNVSEMLRLQMGAPYTYNEFVLGTERWKQDPVAAIEAFFFVRGSPLTESKARDAHASLVVDRPDAAARVPILSMDLGDADAPFAVA
jgi:hypothetical protein